MCFACLSGDRFYAHMDGAAANLFSVAWVVHGYFVLSAAAGLFVDAGVGPVIANYGLESLRFIEPVNQAIPSRCVSPVSANAEKQRSAEKNQQVWWNGL